MKPEVIIYGLLFAAAAVTALAGWIWGGVAAFAALVLYIIVVFATSVGCLAYIASRSPDVNGEKERDSIGVEDEAWNHRRDVRRQRRPMPNPCTHNPQPNAHEYQNQTHRTVRP